METQLAWHMHMHALWSVSVNIPAGEKLTLLFASIAEGEVKGS